MSIPAQGAVGAETMTAILTDAVEILPLVAERLAGLEDDDEDEVLSCLIDRMRTALASPRADSDERTAGEDHPNVFRVLHALKGSLDSDVIRQSDGLLVGDPFEIEPGSGFAKRLPARYAAITLGIETGSSCSLVHSLDEALRIAELFWRQRDKLGHPLYECVYIRDRRTHRTVLDLDCRELPRPLFPEPVNPHAKEA